MMQRILAVALALAGVAEVASIPTALSAQSVAGRVTESGSDRPVPGAMVRLFTSEGPTGTRHLTAGDGRFRLALPGPGRYEVEVERIGFRPTRAGPVDAVGQAPIRLDVPVPPEPVRLDDLDLSGTRRRCSLEGERGATRLVWSEARKALEAVTWTAREAGLRLELERVERTLDARGRTVLDERRRQERAVGGNPVRTLAPEELARGGFVREEDDLLVYYGPDPDLLLSDAFLATHCFQVVEGPEDRPSWIGLAFDPVQDRDGTGVRGVLLLDRATARLERLHFSYTGPPATPGREIAGGEIAFLGLADGRWVVRDWFIQAPVLVRERTVGAGGRVTEEVQVGSVQESGRRVLSVTGPGDLVWRADDPTGSLRGVVLDSIRGGPLAGAGVQVAGQPWRTQADADGRWSLDDVPPGSYRVRFRHPVLDSLQLDPGWQPVQVSADSVSRVALVLPPLERLLALGCPDPEGGLLVGFVRDGFGRPLEGVEVRVVDSTGVARTEPPPAYTGPDGSYQLCGLPSGAHVEVEAVLGVAASRLRGVVTRGGLAVRTDLELVVSGGLEERRQDGLPSGSLLLGRAVDAATGGPLEAASVELLGPDDQLLDQRLTDAEGRFRIRPPEPGSYRVRIRRLGYAEVTSSALEVEEGRKEVEIRLVPEALELEEGVVVEVEYRPRFLELAGFYRRRADGMGRLFDRAELEAMNLSQTGDIVNRVPTLATLPLSGRGSLDATRRFLRFRRAGRGSGGCLPAIYVDGILVRQGGNWNPAMPSLDELMPADEVEAMELYDGPSSAPARFNSMGSACGVLVIWSRNAVDVG